jgi:hypothetical protein
MSDDLLAMLGCAVVGYAVWAMRRALLVSRVRHVMSSEVPAAKAVKRMRVLLALDGHRMPKHVREAAIVWLAEREGGV